MLDEFYRVAFRKKVYGSLEELQAGLDEWMRYCKEVRTYLGRWCYGKRPMHTFRVYPCVDTAVILHKSAD